MDINALTKAMARFHKLASTLSAEEFAAFLKDKFDTTAEIEIETPETITVTVDDLTENDYYLDNNDWSTIDYTRYGWYLTTDIDSFMLGDTGSTLWFHKIDSETIEPLPQYCYHKTNQKSLDSIKLNGLIPRGGSRRHSFKYPERIYVVRDAGMLLNMDGLPENGIILKIDLTKVPNAVLRVDPQFKSDPTDWTSAYLTVPVPPEAIEEV